MTNVALNNQTLVAVAMFPGQTLTLWTRTVTATEPGETLRVYGTGTATMGPGYWQGRGIYAGDYEGPYFDGDTPTQGVTTHVTYQRRDTPESPWITLAEHVDPGTEITDPTPILIAPEYRAISHTDLPSSNTGPVTVVEWVHEPYDTVFVNTGDGFTAVGRAFGSQATDAPSIEQTGVHFAGIDFPIAIFGDASDYQTTFTGTLHDYFIKKGATTRREWVDLLNHRQVVCYRDCQGRKTFGLLNIGFSQSGPVETVNITVDQVWHEEGVIG